MFEKKLILRMGKNPETGQYNCIDENVLSKHARARTHAQIHSCLVARLQKKLCGLETPKLQTLTVLFDGAGFFCINVM